MLFSTDIWKLLAGVAIFLLGMRFLEDSLQQLAGRSFKLFLKKQTASKPKAVLGGALVTGILQSSSVVNLMVLAFVGAHVMPMQNALAVVLGANLGTTLSNWIIATVGFNFNIEYIAYPLAGVFGIGMTLVKKESFLYKWSKFLFGFGFLFIGLNFMKTGMEDTVKQVDLAAFNHYPVIFFLLLGFIITSLIQSSTATMAILLSALHANAIGLFAATAVALGSEAGTSIKLLLASVKGLPDKKRVAYGNL
ncbi:MAG: Na/Pi symporter, partial [Ferruginibacter sp.]|nr:Na/Pi symporter [Ferruginibacter sp.]